MICDSTYRKYLPKNQRYLIGLLSLVIASLGRLYTRDNIIIVLLAMYLLYINSHYYNKLLFSKFSMLILGNKFTKFMAAMSYSVYLFHGIFISYLGYYLFSNKYFLSLKSYSRVTILFVCVFCTYLFSFLIYKFIELPFIGFGKRITRRLDSKPAELG
jgi:peptidoglycan/LPS O-acetylase OafA/YrhL